MMEAERFPEDFEGIIAGAPANHWTHHFAGFLWNERALESTPESKLGMKQLTIVETATVAACDALDGVKDGLISNPRKCHFDPASLLCTAGADASDNCLTQPQIDALKKIYAGPKNLATGEQIYPGYESGTEAEAGAWTPWIVPGAGMPASLQAMFGHSMYAQAVHENSQFDTKAVDLDHELRLAEAKTSAILDSYNPDLRSFRAHGGKLIQYHGWGDAAIAPRDSIAFYELVQRFLDSYPDPRASSETDIHAFYRLFMVPGMGHCAGGPGPTNFSGGDPSIPSDAEHNILEALDRWVTTGTAPEKIIGTGQANGVKMTRPLCPYPKVAKYMGQGDPTSAQSFACVAE
jgi:feruloyl esterase